MLVYYNEFDKKKCAALKQLMNGGHKLKGILMTDQYKKSEQMSLLDTPDGKQRLIEPSIPLLVNGDSERVGLIHAAGDAIVPQVAAEFIKAFRRI